MNKIIAFLIVVIALFLFPTPVNAQWSKYLNNPIISPATQGCDSVHASSPSVLFDQGQYKMWYQGLNNTGWSICYATSTNGINWIKNPTPIITTSSYGGLGIQEVNEPSVLNNLSTYQMWFKERVNNKNRVRYGTSVNGIDWNIEPEIALEGTQNTWDYDGPTNPYVYFDGSQYYLWYLANNGSGGPWLIGNAISADGIHWTKNINNPLNIPYPTGSGFLGGMSMLKINNKYHLWYHVGNNGQNVGIYHVVSDSLESQNWLCDQSCEIFSRTQNSFDQSGIVCPDVISIGSQLMMWYGGNDGVKWQIGLATYNLPAEPTNTPTPIPTSMPTPTITPTSTPTPTPTPLPQKPYIIIIPGMFASWNKEAILHNKAVKQDEWKLAPYVNEYNGIINTLNNLGYKENSDYHIFAYDWRKNIENLSDDLDVFLKQEVWSENPHRKIQIIGHSLGGLVGRIWAQKYQQINLNKLITIGSPHLGTAQVYKAVQAGEIDKSNNTLWFTEKLILMLNKNPLQSDKASLNSIMPVLKDLLPIYPYLKSGHSLISLDSMEIKNNLLPRFTDASTLFPYLYTIAGNKGPTLSGYTIKQRSKADKLLNNYIDGKPSEEIKSTGDYVITQSSSSIGNNIKELNFDHSELIYKKESLKEMLNILKIDYQDSQVIEGQPTVITPSIIFVLKSPAEIKVIYNNKEYSEKDGIIFIPNAVSGTYKIEVIGTGNGSYSLITGQIGTNTDNWTTIKGNTQPNQLDSYTLNFHSKNPKEFIIKNKHNKLWCEFIKKIFRNWKKIKC